MTVFRAFLLSVALAFSSSVYAAPRWFTESQDDVHVIVPSSPGLAGVDWEKLLNQGNAADVTFGVRLLGPSPYNRNDELSFTPASNAKLFTAAAALSKFGADYRIPTVVSWRQVDQRTPGTVTELTVTGGGDPTWGMTEFGESLTSRFEQLADALVAEGIRSVRGPVRFRAADPRWNVVSFPEGWLNEDRIYCYGALPQAFNVQGNCATFVVTSPTRGFWKEEGVPVAVALDIKPGTKTELSVESLDRRGVAGAAYRITGTWKTSANIAAEETGPGAFESNAVVFELPVHRASDWARNLLVRALRERGVRFSATRARSTLPYVHSLTRESPPLSAILKPFLKDSVNLIGEDLFKLLGQAYGDPRADLLTAGRAVMEEFVSSLGGKAALASGIAPRLAFFSRDVTLYDGSGVSRKSSVTTDAVMALLLDLRVDSNFPAIWAGLPIAGVDGTLKSRMKGTAAENTLRAKTGTLRGVYNLSGYVPRFDGVGGVAEYVPFVVLTKTDAAHRVKARAAQDRVGAALAAAVNTGARLP